MCVVLTACPQDASQSPVMDDAGRLRVGAPVYPAQATERIVAPAVVEEVEPVPEPTPEHTHEPFSLTGWARRVADCESGIYKSNGKAIPGSYGTNLTNHQGSSASGLFHFLDSTWQAVNAKIGGTQYARALHAPEEKQLEAFNYLWDNGNGAHHWNASRSCWR